MAAVAAFVFVNGHDGSVPERSRKHKATRCEGRSLVYSAKLDYALRVSVLEYASTDYPSPRPRDRR